MKTLGIHISGLTSSAALVNGRQILAAAAEERFVRRKYQRGFPTVAAEYCLAAGGLKWRDLDCIAIGWNPAINLAGRYQGKYSDRARFPGDWLYTVSNQVLSTLKPANIGATVQNLSIDGRDLRLVYVNHHDAHAANCFCLSPFDEAAVFTSDFYGEDATTTWKVASAGGITTLKEVRFPQSIGAIYAAFTEYLGYRPNKDEWKVMGLAAYGDPSRYQSLLARLVELTEDGDFHLDLAYFNHYSFETEGLFSSRLENMLGPRRTPGAEITTRHRDIAAAIQALVEKIMFHCLDHLHRVSGLQCLCMAGGCLMNSVFNGKVLGNTPFEALYVPFAPDDCGNSIGAALFANWQDGGADRHFATPSGPFLGPAYSDEEVKTILDRFHLTYDVVDRPAVEAARLVADGNIIGWFQGRMEFGARALGNRSILADPRDPGMKDKVNHAIKFREGFRPFAPSVLQERVFEYFELPHEAIEVPYMEQVYRIREERRSGIPAVVHADGSGRLQTVRKDWNPAYYELIKAFEALTGVPMVLNTSFNLKGEPIVCSPSDAIRTFSTCGLDAVVINRFVIRKPSTNERL